MISANQTIFSWLATGLWCCKKKQALFGSNTTLQKNSFLDTSLGSCRNISLTLSFQKLAFDTFARVVCSVFTVTVYIPPECSPFLKHAATNWGYYTRRHETEQREELGLALEILGNNDRLSLATKALQYYRGLEDGFVQRSGVSGLHLASFFGLRLAVDRLIQTEPDALRSLDGMGWSYLRLGLLGPARRRGGKSS